MNRSIILNNLNEARAIVEAAPADSINLDDYRRETECGTLFCTAGLLASSPYFMALGMYLRPIAKKRHDADPTNPRWTIERQGFLGSDMDTWLDPMFGPSAWGNLFTPANTGVSMHKMPPGSTHKDLALKRIDLQIAYIKELPDSVFEAEGEPKVS